MDDLTRAADAPVETAEGAEGAMTRRKLLRTGAKVGAALVAFIPAAVILVKTAPSAAAYVQCSAVLCKAAGLHNQYHDCWTDGNEYACVDSRNLNFICSCARTCSGCVPG